MANPADRTEIHPATDAVAITEGVAFPQCRAVYIGGDGNLVARMSNGTGNVTFNGVKAGSILPISIDLVDAATTAANLVALY